MKRKLSVILLCLLAVVCIVLVACVDDPTAGGLPTDVPRKCDGTDAGAPLRKAKSRRLPQVGILDLGGRRRRRAVV